MEDRLNSFPWNLKRRHLICVFLLIVIAYFVFATGTRIEEKSLTPTEESYSTPKNIPPATVTTDGKLNSEPDLIKSEFPKIIHQSYKDYDSMTPKMKFLQRHCQEVNPTYKLMFWNDTTMNNMMQENFPEWYPFWSSMKPRMKQIDMFRFFLIYKYGGIYIDIDVECVNPFENLFHNRPYGAYIPSWPEVFCVMGFPGHPLTLHNLETIKNTYENSPGLDVWHTTGPAAWSQGIQSYIRKYGLGVIFENKTEFEIDWIELPKLREDLKDKPTTNDPKYRIQFFWNGLFDPPGCGDHQLKDCKYKFDGLCKDKWPNAWIIHHCVNSWRDSPLNKF